MMLAYQEYILVRNPQKLDHLKEVTKAKNFKWEHPTNIQADIPLFLLEEGETDVISKLASEDSCVQSMLERSAFCCSMFTEILPLIQDTNNLYKYRRCHYEAGMIGQVLYTEGKGYHND